MSTKNSIFTRRKLRPSQLRTVADRRFDDATALVASGKNARANGAMYLGGFVVECLLKASLLERYPWLQSTPHPPGASAHDLRIWSLAYRQHDLEELLLHLPHIQSRLQASGSRNLGEFGAICATWTIFARYSPQSAMISEAARFLAVIKEIKPWLR
jgi:hypothetical protein